MRKKCLCTISFLVVGLLLTLSISNPCFSNQPVQTSKIFEIKGSWQGTLKVAGTELRILFHISENEEGILSATMDSPDQGATGIPTSEVIFRNDSLLIMANSIAGKYEGKIDKKNDSINGKWKQGGYVLDLALTRKDDTPPKTEKN